MLYVYLNSTGTSVTVLCVCVCLQSTGTSGTILWGCSHSKKGYPGTGWRWGGGDENEKIHWGIIFSPKMMVLQGVRHPVPYLGVSYVNDPKKSGGIWRPCLLKYPYCHQIITQTHPEGDRTVLEKVKISKNFQPAHACAKTAKSSPARARGEGGGGGWGYP